METGWNLSLPERAPSPAVLPAGRCQQGCLGRGGCGDAAYHPRGGDAAQSSGYGR